ncbi:Panacea domain-containing protein [Komagataeibacter oboediens]|uniref:Panacea domain-containing protein n=1 Tax=Komagataeibacter oboediens TaxID=65958 RepID=UPI001C2D76F1|nr:type II toxin-antitoxin system antitoxin SocA domain-containing protein [Komagataeibacter oboediens]MBV1823336.1 DUF4065 domain-containing protein [Komagataeibacter oboediens]
MADAITVANRFLALAQKRNATLTPMQVLKLVYLAHGWMLGLYGRPLFQDSVQAWQYGPVIPSLYNKVRSFKSQPVIGPLPSSDPKGLTPEEESVADQVYAIYGDLSGPALSRLTHAPNTPWSQTYDPHHFGLQISNDLIENFYRAKLAEGD